MNDEGVYDPTGIVKKETDSVKPSCDQGHCKKTEPLRTNTTRSESGKELSMLVGAGGMGPDQLIQDVELLDLWGTAQVEAWFDTGAGPSVVNPDRLIARFPAAKPILAKARFDRVATDLVFADGRSEPITSGYTLLVRAEGGGLMQVTAWESRKLNLAFLIGARDLRKAGVMINMGTGRVSLPLTSNNIAAACLEEEQRLKRKREKQARRRQRRAENRRARAEQQQLPTEQQYVGALTGNKVKGEEEGKTGENEDGDSQQEIQETKEEASEGSKRDEAMEAEEKGTSSVHGAPLVVTETDQGDAKQGDRVEEREETQEFIDETKEWENAIKAAEEEVMR